MLWLISFWRKLNETVAQLGMNTSEAKARESATLDCQGDAGSNPASLTNSDLWHPPTQDTDTPMDTQTTTPPQQPAEGGLSRSTLFGDLYVIEARHRKKNKDLSEWQFVAALKERDDAYNFYGRYHQNTCARVIPPNA